MKITRRDIALFPGGVPNPQTFIIQNEGAKRQILAIREIMDETYFRITFNFACSFRSRLSFRLTQVSPFGLSKMFDAWLSKDAHLYQEGGFE